MVDNLHPQENKEVYETPQLTTFGDVEELTQGNAFRQHPGDIASSTGTLSPRRNPRATATPTKQ